MFVENTPGLPDNSRLSSSGGYWIAMAAVYPSPGFSMFDFLSEKSWIKRMIFKSLCQETVTKFVSKHRLVVELSKTGSYGGSFHDPLEWQQLVLAGHMITMDIFTWAPSSLHLFADLIFSTFNYLSMIKGQCPVIL